MTVRDSIRKNADMVVQTSRQISGIDGFGFNAESVAWIDGYIERLRVRPEFDDAAIAKLCDVLGSFLGECVIACYGGQWQEVEGTWAVEFSPGNMAFPFNKVRKQFAGGWASGDSILGWFESIRIYIPTSVAAQEPKKKPWWKLW